MTCKVLPATVTEAEVLQMLLDVVDVHSGGAPCRIVTGGLDGLGIAGSTMLEKKRYVEQNLDWLRTSLLQEPRGHPAVNADLVVDACDPTADIGMIIINQRAVYPLMSGGNILCFVTAILESGVVPIDSTQAVTTVRVDTPAGLVIAHATCSGNRVLSVTVENVPSFPTHLDKIIDVPGVGTFTVDVAFGGAWYLMIQADELGVKITPEDASRLCELGERVRAAAYDAADAEDSFQGGLREIDAVNILGSPQSVRNHGRSAVVMPMVSGAPRRGSGVRALVDRCPCGTGTSALVATLVAKGELALDEDFRQESILDQVYSVRAIRRAEQENPNAIVPAITGVAHVTAWSKIVLGKSDPLNHGFTVGDVWPSDAVSDLGYSVGSPTH